MDIIDSLVTSCPQLSADRFLFNPSHPFHRFWKLLMLMVAVYVLWLSLCVFGFVFDISKTIWKNQDYVTCAIIFLDCLVSCNTVYVDENTNATVTDHFLIIKHYLYGWGTMDLISAIPISAIVLPFPAINVIIVRVWTCIRLVHIRKVFNTLKSWKKSSNPKLVSLVKWIEIIFITLFTIHCKACILYLIAHTNPDFERTWLSLVKKERAKASNQELYDYTVSIYWSTTSFTTVGYGDIHPVNVRERMVNLAMMVFGVGLISYLTSCVNELLATSNEREERLEALEEFNRNSSLPDELRQEMFNHLSQHRRGELEMMPQHNILNYFPKNIQMKVKNNLFPERISQVYLFDGVSASFRSHLVAEMEFQTFSSNEMVILDNEFPANFWILLNGNMVRDIPNNVQGIPLLICGELGVISNLPQPFSVRATEKSTLLTMKRTKFLEVLKVNRADGEIIFSNMLQDLAAHPGDEVLNSFHRHTEEKLNRGEIEITLSIHFAISRNNSRLLLHLIKQGLDLEEEYAHGQTILHVIANDDNVEPRMMSILLQYSPDVNKRDSTNQPSICYALAKRRRVILDVFRERGVRIPSDKVINYCKFAIQNTDLELLELLDYLGVDMNLALDKDGNTPIHYAVSRKNIQVVRYLLKLKADFYTRNINGTSALELAATLHSKVILGLMCSWSYKRRSIM